jgi:hypothetical protein
VVVYHLKARESIVWATEESPVGPRKFSVLQSLRTDRPTLCSGDPVIESKAVGVCEADHISV